MHMRAYSTWQMDLISPQTWIQESAWLLACQHPSCWASSITGWGFWGDCFSAGKGGAAWCFVLSLCPEACGGGERELSIKLLIMGRSAFCHQGDCFGERNPCDTVSQGLVTSGSLPGPSQLWSRLNLSSSDLSSFLPFSNTFE